MGKDRTTRTLNPLHFEDLEPHRFEDLIRQLVYDFRPWKRLEPTGRLGADDGIDIRGVEAVSVEIPVDGGGDEDEPPGTIERLWTIQCKRERSIHPADIKTIVAEAIPDGSEVPYGFIFSAACDFSKRSRDTFIIELRDRGVEEFYLWGKADLEDMLFQPKNDHLLFAYFGISLQIRRRSRRTEIRTRLATKRSLYRQLIGDRDPLRPFSCLLNRDASLDMPTSRSMIKPLVRSHRLVYSTCIGCIMPEHLGFIVSRHPAYIDDDRIRWDAMLGVPDHEAARTLLAKEVKEILDIGSEVQEDWEFYSTISYQKQAYYNKIATVHFDRIVAFDEHGDPWTGKPHLIVDYDAMSGAFEQTWEAMISKHENLDLICHAKPENRIEVFPSRLRGAIMAPDPSSDSIY